MAEVLKVIKSHPDYRKIFHATHVFNSSRLKNGFAELTNKRRTKRISEDV